MDKLDDIKGVGPKTIKLLEKLGITSKEALITYYPYRYNIIKRSDLKLAKQDEQIIIDGVVENVPALFRFKKNMDKMNFRLNTGQYLLNVVIFNRVFMKSKLTPGSLVTVFGKYEMQKSTILASDIRLGELPDYEMIEPVYRTTSGLSSRQLKTFIDEIFPLSVKDYIPHYLQEKYQFLNKEESLKEIHQPNDKAILNKAQERLKYEELFLFMLKVNYLKQRSNKDSGLARDVDYEKVTNLIDKLPFTLTSDQLNSISDIYHDLIEPKRMNRLLQGDVGSGKTVVAFISMYINFLSGYQSALMAPTDVLAQQHFNNLKTLFKDQSINIKLLTGKLSAKDKKDVLRGLKEGQIDMVVGTHALFSDNVLYSNLGLVITDEQHRFGVAQRSNLKNKGQMPDILYMSATPIPRTYALTIYGDMDVSTIKVMPKGRQEIKTYIKTSAQIKDVLTTMYEELKMNHQVYVVAPLVSESEKIDLENISDLEGKMDKAFGKLYKIGVLHGKMDSKEKEKIMTAFYNNEINILISTTVIEVGVDNPNATLMVIFDSYRFGLSTIHQLRGRVGRSALQSYCILISDREVERLNILTKTNDGFIISEEDFKTRGSGDLFGIRQSGDMAFQIADIKADFDLLLKAKEDSLEYLKDKKQQNDLDIVKLLAKASLLD